MPSSSSRFTLPCSSPPCSPPARLHWCRGVPFTTTSYLTRSSPVSSGAARQPTAERRRLADLYQAGLLELEDLPRRATELDARRRRLETERIALLEQREALLKHRSEERPV